MIVSGCLKHSHDLERRNIRISRKTKDFIAHLLSQGVEPKVVIENYFARDLDPKSKPVTYADVLNIQKQYKLQGKKISLPN